MSIDEFQSFIENKIMKSKDVYEIIGKEQDLKEISLDGMREVYNSLLKKLNQYYQENNPNRILRRNILGIGILYCLSSNIEK